MSVLPGRYWDSNAFLGWLNREPTKFELCDAVLEAAKSGQCRLVTSTLTFAEVFWMKRGSQLPESKRAEIVQLFDYSWVVAVELDRSIAEMARRLIWSHGLESWDAVHVASAIRARAQKAIDCFDTFDAKLSGLTGKIEGTDLLFGLPNLPPRLPFATVLPGATGPSQPTEQSLVADPLIVVEPAPGLPSGRPADQGQPPPDSSLPGVRRPPSAR